MKQWLGRPSALKTAFRSAFSRFGGRVLNPIFAPLLTTLRDTFSGTDAEASIRASTATYEDYAGVLQTAAINQHRFVGARWDGSAYQTTDLSGNPLNPTKDMSGATWTRSIADWTPATYAVDEECNYGGYWYKSTGGTDTTTFNDGGSWVQQGLYSRKYGLLVEETRTNLLTYSEQLDNIYWGVQAGYITPNTIVAPDGTMSADTLTSKGGITCIYSPSGIGTASASVQSAYIKYGNVQYANIRHGSPVNLANDAIFDLVNGTVYSPGTFTSVGIEDVGDGWYRIFAAGNISPFRFLLGLQTTAVTTSAASGEYAHIWGLQYEDAKPTPSTYIPTTTAAVTRATEAGNIKWGVL